MTVGYFWFYCCGVMGTDRTGKVTALWGKLDIPDAPPHLWAMCAVLSVCVVASVAVARKLTEQSRENLVHIPPTVTATCPAPLETEALVITVTSDGKRTSHLYTGRAR